MRVTKAQSFTIAFGALILFFVGGIMLVQSKRTALTPPPLSDSERAIRSIGTEQSPAHTEGIQETHAIEPSTTAMAERGDSPLTMKAFHRSEIKDGKKVWEIRATEGRFFPERSQAEVIDPDLWVFTKEGDRIQVQAKRAVLHLDGSSLSRAELHGNVHLVRNDELTVDTESAEYDKVANVVHAEGLVRMVSPSIEVSGVGMEVQVDTQVIRLKQNVESVVRPQEVSSKSHSQVHDNLESVTPRDRQRSSLDSISRKDRE